MMLAWASTEVPALTRIWFRVNAIVSLAMSASRMALSEAEEFSSWMARVLMVNSSRFCDAPNRARRLFTLLRALSIVLMAETAPR